ncbi:pseudouridine-5'-phosphate glycosidase [Acholeplasma granularum]|uniref:pseudouridine-5'-phosphate glycosidase n=1 Tax=Acholeplasma granularum TaxID=264635 RepID=UPI00047191D0|nr:pseudouridine-5'-phosphate glycosidase [Acholeplasma granularum]
MNPYIDIHPKVLNALRENKAVVALESTIICHGLPYPKNIETALTIEKIVEQEGAVPATIAIINGRIKVGLEPNELTKLASQKNVLKVSKRDIAYCVTKSYDGATTVSATLLIADMVGIKVFATGGIGGVHRNYHEVLDISRDLEDLSNKNIAVVSSGVKSILDIPNTLEYLETKGVEVIGYQTHDFPAFYSKSSGNPVTYQIDDINQIAKLMYVKWSIGLNGSILIANPISSIYSIPNNEMEESINIALEMAKQNKIKGKDITPYILKNMQENKSINSLESNIQLIYSNAKLAAKIAIEFFKF